MSVERSHGSVRVANTSGVDASYDVTTVSISAELTRVQADDPEGLGDVPEVAREFAALVALDPTVTASGMGRTFVTTFAGTL